MVAEFHYHMGTPFFPRRAITDGRYKLIHNLLAGQSKPANGIDGDEAWEFAQRLPETHPARLAMERLADPPQWELYDLRKDPVEFSNRAGEHSLRAVESRLKAALGDWQQRTRDPFRDPEFRRAVQAKHQQLLRLNVRQKNKS